MHMGKTKILTNDHDDKHNALRFGSVEVEILPPNTSADYLGRKLCLDRFHDTEIEARLDKAWRKFFVVKSELCGRHVRLSSRLKIFNAMVTPTFLYGSGAWTVTAERERKIRTAQRRMLRWILGSGRKPLAPSENDDSEDDDISEPEEIECEADMTQESWLDWIRRTTKVAEEHLHKSGLDDWVTAVRRKKWRWAGHLARRSDGRWDRRLLTWSPLEGRQNRGRPCKRWSSDLDAFFQKKAGYARNAWIDVAQDRAIWQMLEDEFIAESWRLAEGAASRTEQRSGGLNAATNALSPLGTWPMLGMRVSPFLRRARYSDLT
jgi:hypothetical protein